MGKKLIKRAASVLTSVLLLPSAVIAYAAAPVMTGDLNGDGSVNISDAVLLSSYLHGRTQFTREQFALSDINSDGSADSLDLAALRFIVAANSGRMPHGTWIASDDVTARYFCFDGEKGTVTDEETGVKKSFRLSVDGDCFTFDYGDTSEEAHVSWLGSKAFNITWSGDRLETMRYYSDGLLNYDDLLTGQWIGSGTVNRVYDIKGVNGSYLDTATNKGTSFRYEKNGNDLYFHSGRDEDTAHAVITPVDSVHIDLTWDDGTSERLTKHNVEQINGITYVNGILIANKTYDLPSTYNPGGILPEAQAAFNEMKAAAARDGLNLWICSGFRDYWTQYNLYWNYVNRDGQWAADTYSARPGHSEHQTGLAIDINDASSNFNGTPAAKWIAAHCTEYGFIIRYPYGKQDKTGFMYEPWHVRYVGKDLAKKITASGLCLEEYLGIDSYYH